MPRTIITTDGEADDMNSFMRLLYYANELDIEGLVYTSSVHHWKGDGVHTLKQAQQAGLVSSYQGETAGSPARSEDALSWRWEPIGWMERKITQDYSAIYPNLLRHDPNYPSPAELWSKVAVGNVAWENDAAADTAGSNLIRAALLDDDARPLYLEAWGGLNTIARALLSIEQEFGKAADWPQIHARVSRKAVISAIGQQDNAYRDHIARAWPDIKMLDFGTVFGGFTAWAKQEVSADVLPWYQAAFWAPHIKYGHGPLLAQYGLVGDGTYFEGEGDNPGWQPGQAKDLATFRQFNVFGGFARLDWTGEGDTPAFISLVPTGLRFLQDPGLGGWGGRLRKSAEGAEIYEGATDQSPVTGKPSGVYTEIRWMPEIANDFAARADWGVASGFAGANHAPRVAIEGQGDPTARPGQSIRLAVLACDPDADGLEANWWIYADASTLTGEARLQAAASGKGAPLRATVRLPRSARPGERLVVVATVRDDGTPRLSRYAEFVIHVE